MNQLVRSREWNGNPFAILNTDWDVFSPQSILQRPARLMGNVPAVDIQETDTEFKVVTDLPGVSKDALDVSVKNDVLSIVVRDQSDNEGNAEGRVIRKERFRGETTRSFKLGDSVDSENIQASYKDGVLSITVPKKESPQSRKIEISVH